MALYHCSAKIIGRSGGKSAVGSNGYDMRIKVIDEETGEVLDYRNKGKTDPCLLAKRLIPKDCPEQFKVNGDFSKLWNEVQRKENRKNSQFARDFNIALQKELTIEQNYEVIKKWFFQNFKGVIADVAIHAAHKNKDGTTNDNLHAHIMITTRRVDKNSPDGWGEKDRDSNSKEFLNQARKSLADLFNEKFKELGINEHIDHRTLEEQGIDREPQQHMGPIATAIERSGRTPDRQRYATEVIEQTEQITKVIDEEVNKSLENNKEFRQLQFILQQLKDREEQAEKEIEEYKKNQDREKLLEKYNFYESVSMLSYVQNNAEEERQFYESQPKTDIQKRQLELLPKILEVKTFHEGRDPNRNNIVEYRNNTMQYYPSHWENIKTWFKDKADVFVSGIKTMANKLGDFVHGNKLLQKNQEQNQNTQKETRKTTKGIGRK